jgi:hypothetical protein
MPMTQDEIRKVKKLGRVIARSRNLMEVADAVDVSPSQARQICDLLRQAAAGVRIRQPNNAS